MNAGPHAVTGLSDGTLFDYDANGNMQRKTASGVVTDYIYDAENRLIEARKNGVKLASYEYDGDGGRTKRTVYQSPAAGPAGGGAGSQSPGFGGTLTLGGSGGAGSITGAQPAVQFGVSKPANAQVTRYVGNLYEVALHSSLATRYRVVPVTHTVTLIKQFRRDKELWLGSQG